MIYARPRPIMVSTRFCVLFILAPWLMRKTQAEGTQNPNSYNCSHRYELRLPIGDDNRNSYCQDSCIETTPSIMANCMTLHDILQSANITNGDCLELTLTPGEYIISSSSQVEVNYSVAMTSPDGGVTFSCGSSTETICMDDGRDSSKAMISFDGEGYGNVFVKIEGINFRYCSGRLQFDELEYLSVVNCKFLGFTGSALDLFNVQHTVIQSSTFKDCTSNNGSDQFRANSGSVSISYYKPETPQLNVSHPSLSICNCTFVNNSAFLPNTTVDQINLALTNNYYYGRGGGLSIVPQGYYTSITGLISNTTFHRNQAETFGGAVLLFIAGTKNHHKFRFEDCIFLENSGGNTSYGGGLQIALLSNLMSFPTRVTIVDCYFERNYADFGGGLGAVQVYSQGMGNEVSVVGTRFVNNEARSAGSAVMCQTFAYVQSRFSSYYYNFTNCSYSDNTSPGGTFGAGFTNMNFFGTLQFTNNTGPGLRLVGSLAVMNGKVSFLGNNVLSNEGGALYIQGFGQIKLRSGAQLEFINNTGRIGSAIVVDVQRSSPVFSELVYNPQCFLIHEDTTLPPANWSDVSIRFSGNKANIGPVIYISHLLHCSWYSSVSVSEDTNAIHTIFSIHNFTRWSVLEYDLDNIAISSMSQSDSTSFIQTQPVTINSDIAMSDDIIDIRPGQTIPLDLSGMDQFMNPTYIIARVSDGRSNVNSGAFTRASTRETYGSNNNTLGTIRFVPALLPIQPNEGMTNISYGFTVQANQTANTLALALKDGEIVPVVIDTPFDIIEAENLRFNVNLTSCRPGYQLTRTNNLYTCQCVADEFGVLNCEDDVIILRDGMWAGKEEEPIPHLEFTVCPAPYCRCYSRGDRQSCESLYYLNINESSQQCHPPRNGTLCGRCVNGTSVGILRTNCRTCKDKSFYALGFLIVWDAIVVGLLLFGVIKLNLHFPHYLKGLLFYVQTVYYATEHFPISFWDTRKYMLYVSSFLGLYFPYDFCLYPGMTALVSYVPKFIPSAVAVIMVTIVIIGAYAMRARNGRKNVWRGMWTLMLLLYAPLFHTCVALMKCPEIPGKDGEDERHWFYDGEVVCFKDTGHIILFLIAIIVLIILILLIPTIFIITIFRNPNDIKKRSLTVEWIVSALMEGYRDSLEARWWASWELLRRLLIISIVVALPGRSVASLFVIIIAFSMHVFFKPYKKDTQNIIEMFVLLNYIFLLLVRSTQTFLDNTSSLGYTGTDVPDYLGSELPYMYNDVWLFVPFFYFPLLFAVIFSLGALIYRIIKSLKTWKKRKNTDSSFTGDASVSLSSWRYNTASSITTTEVGISGTDWQMLDSI